METVPVFKYVVIEEVCGFYSRLGRRVVGDFCNIKEAYELKKQLESKDTDKHYNYSINVIT